ncbi:MAG: RDD family protein [Planctomycetes bacterium]|nr:RDD family protein [Planctomycetota bacterium]
MPCKNHLEVMTGLVSCERCGGTFCRDCVIQLKGLTFCAGCKGEQVRDIQSGADSTELPLASPGRRLGAVMVDGLVVVAPMMGLYFATIFLLGLQFDKSGQLPLLQQILVGLIAGIPGLLYQGLMLQMKGQTLGKMALKIKVVTPEGADITPAQAWTRELTRAFINLLHVFSILNYLPIFRKERTCIHDMVAKTRVVMWRS